MEKLSVVILNFNRPDYIKKSIIPKLLEYNRFIDEIIISHGKKETYFDKIRTKYDKEIINIKHLKHWEENKIYGLTLRFHSALEAKNNNIIIMDDDIIPDKDSVAFLKEKIEEDNERIYGIYGRNIDDKNEYQITNCFGIVPIVLTRCLITSKDTCKYFMDNYKTYENELIKNSKPYWNGEDILFSFLSIEKHGKLPKAYELKHSNRVGNYFNYKEESISFDNSHLKYRQELTKYLVDKIKIREKIKDEKKIKHWKTQVSYFVQNSILIWLFYMIAIFIFIVHLDSYIIRV